MTEPWYKRPKCWERVELVAALLGCASGMITLWHKLFGALWACACAAVVIVAKYRKGELEKAQSAARADYIKRAVGAVLEALSAEYFSKVEAGERHNHRVTLFFVTDGEDGATKQLQIYQRAGVYKASTTAFTVSEDEEVQCEGVAGRIWFCSAERTVALPDWGESESQQTDYATRGVISPARARELKVKSKVLSGTVVRVSGDRWGVLMVDSKTTGYITPKKEHILTRYAALVARLLEEAQ